MWWGKAEHMYLSAFFVHTYKCFAGHWSVCVALASAVRYLRVSQSSIHVSLWVGCNGSKNERIRTRRMGNKWGGVGWVVCCSPFVLNEQSTVVQAAVRVRLCVSYRMLYWGSTRKEQVLRCNLSNFLQLWWCIWPAISQRESSPAGWFTDFRPIYPSVHILPLYYCRLHSRKHRQTPDPSRGAISSNVVITQRSFVIIMLVCVQVWLKNVEEGNHWPRSDWIVMETLRGWDRAVNTRRKRIKGCWFKKR